MFNEDESRKLFATRWWMHENFAAAQDGCKKLAVFQLSQNILCMPYFVYHKAVEAACGEGFKPEKLQSLRFDLLFKLTGSKYQKTDDECLQLLPESARKAIR